MGVPVEESLPALLPAAAAMVALGSMAIRQFLQRLYGRNRR